MDRKGTPTELCAGVVKWVEDGEEPIYDVNLSVVERINIHPMLQYSIKTLFDFIMEKIRQGNPNFDPTDEQLDGCMLEAIEFVCVQENMMENNEATYIRFRITMMDILAQHHKDNQDA